MNIKILLCLTHHTTGHQVSNDLKQPRQECQSDYNPHSNDYLVKRAQVLGRLAGHVVSKPNRGQRDKGEVHALPKSPTFYSSKNSWRYDHEHKHTKTGQDDRYGVDGDEPALSISIKQLLWLAIEEVFQNRANLKEENPSQWDAKKSIDNAERLSSSCDWCDVAVT